jgi:hypothetical protein
MNYFILRTLKPSKCHLVQLEGPREVPMNQYYPSQHVLASFGASQIQVPGGGHHIQTVSSSVQTRRLQTNEKTTGIAVSNAPTAISRNEAPHLRSNGMAHLSQARGTYVLFFMFILF